MKRFLILALACLLTGCSAERAGRAATKTVSFVGKTATKTTVAAVKTTGSVAATTTKTVVSTSGHIIASAAKAGFVTVKDVATGVSRQVPYSEGLRLYAATKSAEVKTYMKAFEIVRDGMVLRSDWKKVKTASGNLALKPGDVVHVKPAAKS